MSANSMSKIFETFQEEKQKELEFNEKEREHLDTILSEHCENCRGRLYVKRSKQEGICRRCVRNQIKIDYNGHTQYPTFETLSDANNYLGL